VSQVCISENRNVVCSPILRDWRLLDSKCSRTLIARRCWSRAIGLPAPRRHQQTGRPFGKVHVREITKSSTAFIDGMSRRVMPSRASQSDIRSTLRFSSIPSLWRSVSKALSGYANCMFGLRRLVIGVAIVLVIVLAVLVVATLG